MLHVIIVCVLMIKILLNLLFSCIWYWDQNMWIKVFEIVTLICTWRLYRHWNSEIVFQSYIESYTNEIGDSISQIKFSYIKYLNENKTC